MGSQNKSDRERQIPYDFIYMWNLKTNQVNKQNRLIDAEGKSLVSSRKNGEGVGQNW